MYHVNQEQPQAKCNEQAAPNGTSKAARQEEQNQFQESNRPASPHLGCLILAIKDEIKGRVQQGTTRQINLTRSGPIHILHVASLTHTVDDLVEKNAPFMLQLIYHINWIMKSAFLCNCKHVSVHVHMCTMLQTQW